MISEDVETLLAGLEVGSVGELKRLVDAGRVEFRRHTRRAELATVVAEISDPRERLVAALEICAQAGRVENGIFVCVSVADSGELISASGVWPSEADAFLAGETDREDGVAQVVLPLFVSSVRSGLVGR